MKEVSSNVRFGRGAEIGVVEPTSISLEEGAGVRAGARLSSASSERLRVFFFLGFRTLRDEGST